MNRTETADGATRVEQDYTQNGGMRYGDNFWYATNFTKPFARLSAAKDAIILSVSLFRLWERTFRFERSVIRQLRWRRGIFSLGLQIDHTVEGYPPLILFWVSDRKSLAEGLGRLGYDISASSNPA